MIEKNKTKKRLKTATKPAARTKPAATKKPTAQPSAKPARPPFAYYGGKQRLVPDLLPMIPPHQRYVEPFCGGAALFWAKQPSPSEVINDADGRIVNFYQVCKTDFEKLQRLVRLTMHAEKEYRTAMEILSKPKQDPVVYAWAMWTAANMSFSHKVGAGFAFAKEGNPAGQNASKRESFEQPITRRLARVQIFNRDAIDLILRMDSPDTFFYLDPPYAESDCGHYESRKEVYYRLLEVLPKLKGKWLMSSYPSEQLTKLRKKHGWRSRDKTMSLAVSAKHNAGRTKTECLTWNYDLKQPVKKTAAKKTTGVLGKKSPKR